MTGRLRISPPSPLSSSTMRSRQSMQDEYFDDNLNTISDNHDDQGDNNLEFNNKPLRQPSRKAMEKWPSTGSFMSTLG